jgi:nucleolar MIF4G domain-containing protein 1
VLINSQVTTPIISSDPKDLSTPRNRGAVEEIFIKATKIDMLTMGLVYFLTEGFRDELADADSILMWGVEIAKDILRRGVA